MLIGGVVAVVHQYAGDFIIKLMTNALCCHGRDKKNGHRCGRKTKDRELSGMKTKLIPPILSTQIAITQTVITSSVNTAVNSAAISLYS
jgi:hypothetical protein